MPALAAHVRETAEARLADPLTAGGDLAVAEIAQPPGEADGGIRD